MGDRWEKRKHDAELASIIKKAKKDMTNWMLEIDFEPSEHDLKVWQSGYVYGLNRGTGQSK